MSGVVVVAGIFEPGSVATLVGVEDEAVMRPPEGDVVSRRLVDEDGNVGFDELEIGARYFVTGYVNGLFVMVRTIGVDASAPDTELQQAPVQAETPVIGTQSEREVPVAPEPPEDAPDLGVGVPEAAEAASPVVEPEAAADPPVDPAAPVQAPDVPADPPAPTETETKTATGDSTVTVESNLPGVTAETGSVPPASEPADPSVAPDVPAEAPAVSPDASAPAAEVPAETPQDAGAPAEAPAAAALPADEPPAEATADVPVDPSAPVQAAEPAPAEVPAPEAAVADVPAPVTADEATALQGQAAGLGIETANLTVDQLREQITGRGATPAA